MGVCVSLCVHRPFRHSACLTLSWSHFRGSGAPCGWWHHIRQRNPRPSETCTTHLLTSDQDRGLLWRCREGRGRIKRACGVAGEREELPQLFLTLICLLKMWEVRLESQKFRETLIIYVELLSNQELLYKTQNPVQDENGESLIQNSLTISRWPQSIKPSTWSFLSTIIRFNDQCQTFPVVCYLWKYWLAPNTNMAPDTH